MTGSASSAQRKRRLKNGLHVVAIFEATKGALVLLAGFGILAFIHKDLHLAAEQLVVHLHLNPAKHYPAIFLDAASRVSDPQLWVLALSALMYSLVRFAEAYGLWMELAWAEWFGLLSGGLYIPVEMLEVIRKTSWPRLTILIVNLGVVAYLAYVVLRTRKHRHRHARN